MPKPTHRPLPPANAVPGDIFLLDQPRLRASTHPHYCVVIRVEADRALVNFMSSEFKLFKDDLDIAVYDTDDCFPQTGLKKSTYLITEDYALVDVPTKNLFALGGPVGKITGRLKERVEEWWGDKL